jgi:hypothetical protein
MAVMTMPTVVVIVVLMAVVVVIAGYLKAGSAAQEDY